MKRITKYICLALAGLAAMLTGCTPKREIPKVLKIGFTYYEPMTYFETEAGQLMGFDAEFARMVCAELGYTPEFVEIIWEHKVADLQNGTIDCIWNGMTITEELQEQILVSDFYLQSRQVAVLPKEEADVFSSVYEAERVAFEKGGAAQGLLTVGGLPTSSVREAVTQSSAIAEVIGGNADAAVVDYVMAKRLVGKGLYDGLTFVEIEDAPEEFFAVGFRNTDAELCEKVNGLIEKYSKDGTFDALKSKYLG